VQLNEFVGILSKAGDVVINVLNQLYEIILTESGRVRIALFGEKVYEEYSSTEEMLENYSVMNMPLGSLVSWMSIEYAR